MAEQEVLRLDKIEKHYGLGAANRVAALKGVSLRLEAGRIYGLVGNNGSGKTTLLRIVAGLSRPDAGRLALFDAESEAELRRARRRLGVLVEAPNYYEDMTLLQNLRAQALLLPREEREDLRELCVLLGITPQVARRRLRKCSLGERQRYGLASALPGRPPLLLLDEPMNGLDPKGVAEVRELILRLNRDRGMTVLVSSHLLGELHKIATDYIFLRFGQVLETLSAEELDRQLEEGQWKDVEAWFLALERAAQAREGSLLGRKEG